jgi:hypothetical protein
MWLRMGSLFYHSFNLREFYTLRNMDCSPSLSFQLLAFLNVYSVLEVRWRKHHGISPLLFHTCNIGIRLVHVDLYEICRKHKICLSFYLKQSCKTWGMYSEKGHMQIYVMWSIHFSEKGPCVNSYDMIFLLLLLAMCEFMLCDHIYFIWKGTICELIWCDSILLYCSSVLFH